MTAETLARRVSAILKEHGYQAYLVGGCVRDLLLRRVPQDFDVATDARPAEVTALFPGALEVGAHFGVVLVREGDAKVEVAAFRSDGIYSDGRRPDQVRYERDPRQDVLRRDFTVNALLLDPATEEVLDFVGGRNDLAAGLIRAIGDPYQRFAEDHLRLLRAVRLAARLGFRVEDGTATAIRELAPRVASLAAERVRDELARIVTEGGAVEGLALLRSLGLLAVVLPEAMAPESDWHACLRILTALKHPSEAQALAALLRQLTEAEIASALVRLRFPNATIDRTLSLLKALPRFDDLCGAGLSAQKRFLRMEAFGEHLAMYRASRGGLDVWRFWEDLRSRYSPEDLRPSPLVTGDDLIALGYAPGPDFARALTALEDEQLEGRISTREAAIAFVRSFFG